VNLFRLPIGPLYMRMDILPELPISFEMTLAPSEDPPPRAGKRLVLVALGDTSAPKNAFFDNSTGEMTDLNDDSGGDTRQTVYQGVFTDQENATGTAVTTFSDGSPTRTEHWTITPD